MIDVDAYLQRINYKGSLAPNEQTLRELQIAHLLAVPFENLSIHSHQPIVLEDDALFDKIVVRRRGGFCYELNGLFAALLRALNFDVVMLSARVANPAGEFGPEFDHMTLLVNLEQRWLADVGFGDSFREPLLVDQPGEQAQRERSYRLVSEGEQLLIMQRENRAEWKPQYRFTLQPFSYADFAGMCHYHQTSPESHFTSKRICTLATSTGRVTLSDLRLIITTANERQERELADEEEYTKLLRELFGIQRI